MISWDLQSLVLAVLGMVGLFATATVVVYSFRRNRSGNGRYQ